MWALRGHAVWLIEFGEVLMPTSGRTIRVVPQPFVPLQGQATAQIELRVQQLPSRDQVFVWTISDISVL
jgi:hypothetical protein